MPHFARCVFSAAIAHLGAGITAPRMPLISSGRSLRLMTATDVPMIFSLE